MGQFWGLSLQFPREQKLFEKSPCTRVENEFHCFVPQLAPPVHVPADRSAASCRWYETWWVMTLAISRSVPWPRWDCWWINWRAGPFPSSRREAVESSLWWETVRNDRLAFVIIHATGISEILFLPSSVFWIESFCDYFKSGFRRTQHTFFMNLWYHQKYLSRSQMPREIS